MIGPDSNTGIRSLVCPMLAMATGKQTRCLGTGCAWFRFEAGPDVVAEHLSVRTTEPVGGCGLIGQPTSQHWFIATGRTPARNSILAGHGIEPFDVGLLNRASAAPAPPESEF